MKVLIVAPAMGLAELGDVLAAVEGNHASLLHGTVTVREVLNRIANGRYDIVHFATHGDRHVLAMSDGLLGEDMLVQAIRAGGGLPLVVLNACASVHCGAELYRGGVGQVICWRAEVGDDVAGWWAAIFYRALRLSGDVWESYRVSVETLQKERPGQEMPIWLNGRLAKLELELREFRDEFEDALVLPRWVGWLQFVLTVVLLGLVVMVGFAVFG